jgi:hypothetical protein
MKQNNHMINNLLLLLAAFVVLSNGACGPKPQVYADVDDTILHPSEFGVGFVGVDEAFEESVPNIQQGVNPGAGAFLLELARGPAQLPNPEGIVILSARPTTGNFGNKVDQACAFFGLWFQCQQIKNMINNQFPDLASLEITSAGGTVKAKLGSPPSDFIFFSFQQLWQNFANRKVINHVNFQAANPNQFSYIFVDDNANGGHVAGARLLSDPNYCVPVAFIHDVVHSPKNFLQKGIFNENDFHPLEGKIDPIPIPLQYAAVTSNPTKYVLYRNFAHAAVLAFNLNYISKLGCKRVVLAIKATTIYKNCVAQQFICIPGDDEGHCDPGCAELRADVAAAELASASEELPTESNNNRVHDKRRVRAQQEQEISAATEKQLPHQRTASEGISSPVFSTLVVFVVAAVAALIIVGVAAVHRKRSSVGFGAIAITPGAHNKTRSETEEAEDFL